MYEVGRKGEKEKKTNPGFGRHNFDSEWAMYEGENDRLKLAKYFYVI